MKRTGVFVAAGFVGAALLVSAFLVRDGLHAVADSIREKPWPEMPSEVAIAEMTVRHAVVASGGGASGDDSTVDGARSAPPALNLTIEDLRIEPGPTPGIELDPPTERVPR